MRTILMTLGLVGAVWLGALAAHAETIVCGSSDACSGTTITFTDSSTDQSLDCSGDLSCRNSTVNFIAGGADSTSIANTPIHAKTRNSFSSRATT